MEISRVDTKKFISLLSFFVIWLGLTGMKFDIIHMVFMVLVPMIIFCFASKLALIPKEFCFDSFKFIKYVLWLIKEIINSSICVSKIAWSRNIAIYPSIKPIISLQDTELGVVIYANSISLTPGTVTLSTDGNKLLVHALDIKFMEDLQEGILERKIEKLK